MNPDHQNHVLAIVAEFEKRRRRQLMISIPAIALVVLGLVLRRTDLLADYNIPMNIFGPVFFGIVVVMIVFSLINWRCPSCRKYIGRNISPRFCQRCGVQFRL